MSRYRRPNLPSDVERMLRQEAGFGCVKCGHPYLQFHHIVPFAEDNHFRPEDMVAVCGNCHNFFETQGRDRQRRMKASPENVRKGEVNGLLAYDKRDLVFKVGGNFYENVPIILQYRSIPLVSCKLEEDQAKVSLNVFNSAGRLVFQVKDNDVTFRLGDMWDFECKRNIAIARSGPREIAVKMDFSKPEATIEGSLWAGGKLLRLRSDHTNIAGGRFTNNRFVNGRVGIQIG